MELKLTKAMSCRVAVKGRWGNRAAAMMGVSFFLRMVYYFGLRNLRDVPTMEVVFSVVLPLLLGMAFLLTLKLFRLNLKLSEPTQTRIVGVLAMAAALNYPLAAGIRLDEVVSDVLVLGLGVLLLGACEGYVPQRKWLLWVAVGTLAFRVLFVDLVGYILPLSQWDILGYLPQCANLFLTAALCCLAPALRLRKE